MPSGEHYVCYLPDAAETDECYSGCGLLALAIYFGKYLAIYKVWIAPERDCRAGGGTG